jgi:hypothetical protein
MKKLAILLFATICCTLCFAQKKVTEYSVDYATKNGKPSFDIEATEPKNGKFTFYIYAWSLDSEPQVGFSIDSKKLPDFFTSLRAVGDKLEEWSKTAKENNVTDYDKKFDVKFGAYTAFFKYGRNWHFCGFKFSPYFKVTKDGECLAVFKSYKLTASDNRFMNHDGFMIPFSSKEEIEDFIKALDPDPILNTEGANAAKDDLFK